MNFSVYLNEDLSYKLHDYVNSHSLNRNQVINIAVDNFLSQEKVNHWSDEIVNFTKCDFPKISRKDLLEPTEEGIF